MLILAAILGIFVYGMIAAMLGTVLPDLAQRFKFTPRQNGSIASMQALGLILASLSVGPLLDLEGKKVGVVLGLVFIIAALGALPRSSGFKPVLWLMFLLGLGGGIIITSANALTSDIAADHRASVLNLVNLFFGLGGFVTPFIAANLFRGSWQRLCHSIAAFSVVTLVFELVTRMPSPQKIVASPFAGLDRVVHNPAMFVLGLFLFLYVSCEVGVWNWLAQYLIARGIPEKTALNVLSFGFALGLLIGRVIASRVLIHTSALTVLLGSSVAMAITTVLILFVRRGLPAMLLVALVGLAMAPVFPTALSIAGDIFPAVAGTAIGIAITCGWIGLAVSSRIIGAIAGGDPRRLRQALVILPVSAVLMVLLSLALPTLAHLR